ncbi:VP5 [Kummerowia striata gokushovirus]|nr:VP5 [Kummerowia striata gokushovirus]
MILSAFSILDRKTGVFAPPFFVRHVGEAIRSFTDACQQKDIPFGRYPEDYVMFCVGKFDDEGGLFEAQQPQQVITALEIVSANALDGRPTS